MNENVSLGVLVILSIVIRSQLSQSPSRSLQASFCCALVSVATDGSSKRRLSVASFADSFIAASSRALVLEISPVLAIVLFQIVSHRL